MSTPTDNEAYWMGENQEKLSYNFNDNEVLKVDMDELLASTTQSEGSVNIDYQPVKPMLMIIKEKTLNCILAMDKFQNIQPEITATQPDITLRNILLGKPYTLEQYKSLANKTALLDAAIISGDGNAILIIILFLTKTLKRALVHKILAERPDAANVYIKYLSTRMQISEITDILTMLGQSKDAAMKNLHIIIKNAKDPDILLHKLRNCYKTQFSTSTECKEALFMQSYIKLLEWQMVVRTLDGNERIELNSSVLDCLRHLLLSECTLMPPMILSQQHDISPRQHQKIALEVKASANKWDDIDKLLLAKGWLGTKKLQIHLPIDDVLKILHKNNAPYEVLDKYLKYVDNAEKQLELAKNLHCFRTAVDILVQQADRIALNEYKIKLQPQSEEYFYAESALRLPTVKWRN